jgi:hypothetical protein
VLKPGGEQVPPRPEDRAVQPGLLTNAVTQPRGGAPGPDGLAATSHAAPPPGSTRSGRAGSARGVRPLDTCQGPPPGARVWPGGWVSGSAGSSHRNPGRGSTGSSSAAAPADGPGAWRAPPSHGVEEFQKRKPPPGWEAAAVNSGAELSASRRVPSREREAVDGDEVLVAPHVQAACAAVLRPRCPGPGRHDAHRPP